MPIADIVASMAESYTLARIRITTPSKIASSYRNATLSAMNTSAAVKLSTIPVPRLSILTVAATYLVPAVTHIRCRSPWRTIFTVRRYYPNLGPSFPSPSAKHILPVFQV